MASGGRHGFAQSLFQVGGNAGSAIGPLAAAFIVLPARAAQRGLVLRGGAARHRGALEGGRLVRPAPGPAAARGARVRGPTRAPGARPARCALALAVLIVLIFSKYIYLTSITSYYTFYLIHHFGVGVQSAQLHLFAFLGAVAAGTIIGGPVGDRFGRKLVIWCSILGVLPFTLALPYVGLIWTGVLSVIIGFILASAFSAILVYAQELVPGKVGMISGLFFGSRLRHRRHRRRGAGRAGRPHQHRVRLPPLRLSARARPAHRLPARSRGRRPAPAGAGVGDRVGDGVVGVRGQQTVVVIPSAARTRSADSIAGEQVPRCARDDSRHISC